MKKVAGIVRRTYGMCRWFITAEIFGNRVTPWTLSIRPNTTEISEREQMVRNFLGRFPENPETVKTIQPKTQKKKKLEAKSNGSNESDISGRKMSKFGYTLRSFPLFRKFRKNVPFRCGRPKLLFHSPLRIFVNIG